MAEATVPPMRDEFPRWYRAVDLAENRTKLESRWEGVWSLVQAADRPAVEAMLAVLLKTKSRPNDQALASLRGHFKAADDMFEMSGNDRELEVLSGAALATLLDGTTDISAWAALSTMTALFAGVRRTDFPHDFAGASEATIARISEARRKRPDIGRLKNVGALGLEADLVQKIKTEGVTPEHMVAAVNAIASQAQAVTHDIAAKANAAINALHWNVWIQDEELQLLWWLYGARSKSLDVPFADVPLDAQPIVFAAEVANSVRFIPGPESAKPILSRAGLKERRKSGIAAAINAVDAGLLRGLVDGVAPAPVVRPLHFAILRKLEAGDDTSWVANWSAVTGIEADATLPGIELGNLFYRERLALKFGS